MTSVENVVPGPLATKLPARIADRRINWLAVARKDVADAARSWQLIALCGLFVGLVQLLTTVPLLSGGETTFADGKTRVFLGTGILLPLVGLLLGYRAVVGEQERGSLRVLLGLPITRRDVVLGKLLGRSVLLGTVLGAGLAVSGGVLWYVAGEFEPVTFLVLTGVTMVFGLVFVWIGVGISAAAQSRAGSMAAVTAVFTLSYFVWNAIPDVLYYLTHGQFHEYTHLQPDEGFVAPWLVFVGKANPPHIFGKFIMGFPSGWSEPHSTSTLTGRMPTQADPFYLQPAFLFLVLMLWGIVPLLIGTWWLGRRDLG